jgi:hypothetical protein
LEITTEQYLVMEADMVLVLQGLRLIGGDESLSAH